MAETVRIEIAVSCAEQSAILTQSLFVPCCGAVKEFSEAFIPGLFADFKHGQPPPESVTRMDPLQRPGTGNKTHPVTRRLFQFEQMFRRIQSDLAVCGVAGEAISGEKHSIIKERTVLRRYDTENKLITF